MNSFSFPVKYIILSVLVILSIILFELKRDGDAIQSETNVVNEEVLLETPETISDQEGQKVYSKQLWYKTLNQEISDQELVLSGSLPEWLKGMLLYIGPAQFEVGNDRVKYWFDGLSMLYKCTFDDGKIRYTNKFLQSNYFKNVMKNGLPANACADPKKKSSFSAKKQSEYDNANINISVINNQLVALTETPLPVIIDPLTLETKGILSFEDKLRGHVMTAHPIFDAQRNTYYNVLLEYGRTSKYHIYCNDIESAKRRVIASIDTKEPSYIHSIAQTEHYIIVGACPLVVNPINFLFSSKPYVEHFVWKPSVGITFFVVDKESGKLVGRYTTDPYFIFHYANAYEENDTIIIDAITYPQGSMAQNYVLSALRSGKTSPNKPCLKRFIIANNAISQTEFPFFLEKPRMNETYKGKPYTFFYAVDHEEKTLLKINITNQESLSWQQEGCFVGEPIFIARPESAREDEGIICSVILDAANTTSFLLILDAETMQEKARAHLPHCMPATFHGHFYTHDLHHSGC